MKNPCSTSFQRISIIYPIHSINGMKITDCFTDESQLEANNSQHDKNSVKKLLFVDDDPAILEGFQYIFEEHGFHVDLANDIEELMKQLDDKKQDLIILDYRIGQMKGTDIAKKILEKKKEVDLIFISGYRDAVVELRRNNIKVAGFLEKPLKAETLLEYIIQHFMEQ